MGSLLRGGAHHKRKAKLIQLDLKDPVNAASVVGCKIDDAITAERATRHRWRGRPAKTGCPDIGSKEARASKRRKGATESTMPNSP